MSHKQHESNPSSLLGTSQQSDLNISSMTGQHYMAQVGGSASEALSAALATGYPGLAHAVQKRIRGDAYRDARAQANAPFRIRGEGASVTERLKAQSARIGQLVEQYGSKSAAMEDPEYRALITDPHSPQGQAALRTWEDVVAQHGDDKSKGRS